MKPHLPTSLRTALLACMAAATLAAPSAWADYVDYSGGIYTFDGYNTGSDLAFGRYVESTQAADGTIHLTETVVTGRSGAWSEVNGIIGDGIGSTGNTLRFTSTNGTPGELDYKFNGLNLGGIIVEAGSADWGIKTTSSSGGRSIYLGNTSDVAAISTFHENFTLDNSQGRNDPNPLSANATHLGLRGTQTWSIDADKTFTLRTIEGKSIIQTGTTNVTGSGTALFSNNLSVGGVFTIAPEATVDCTHGLTLGSGASLSNSGTLNLGGTVSLASSIVNTETGFLTFAGDVRLDLSQLTAEYAGDNCYTYTLFSGGSSNLSSLSVDHLTGVGTTGKIWSFSDDGAISYILTYRAPSYSGSIYTFDGYNEGKSLMEYGRYRQTIQEADGSLMMTDTVLEDTWNGVIQPILNEPGETSNTLRFTATNGTPSKLDYRFNGLYLGGIIVDEGAQGWGIVATNSTGHRSIYLGNAGGTPSFSTIHEDFTLDNQVDNHEGDTATVLVIRGTQTWDIAEGKTFTLATLSYKSIIQSGSTTITGGGAATFSNSLSLSGSLSIGEDTTVNCENGLSMANGASLNNSGTLNLGGTVALSSAITNTGTVHFADGTLLDLSGYSISRIGQGENGQGFYQIIHGGASNWDELSPSQITGSPFSAYQTDWQLNHDGSLSFTWTNEQLSYAGGALSWGNGAFDGQAYQTIPNVTILGDTQATLGSDVSAMVLHVKDGVHVSLEGAYTLTASLAAIEAGSSLLVEDSRLDIQYIELQGTLSLGQTSQVTVDSISVGAGGVLQLDNITNFTGTITGEGTLALNTGAVVNCGTGIGGLGTLVNTDAEPMGELRIMSGTTVEITSSTAQPGVIRSFDRIVVEEGGSLSHRLLRQVNNLGDTVLGRADQTIVLAGAGSDTTSTRAALALGYATKFKGTYELVSQVELAADATVYCESSRVSLFSNTLNLQGYTMTKTGGGTLELRGDVSGQSIRVEEGTLLWSPSAAKQLTVASVSVGSDAMLQVNNLESFHSAVSGAGTLALNTGSVVNCGTGTGGLGTLVNTDSEPMGELRIMSGTTVDLSSSTVQPGVIRSFDRIVVEEGGSLSHRLLRQVDNLENTVLGRTDQTMVLAGAGSDTTSTRAALALGYATKFKGTYELVSQVELAADATVYCESSRASLFSNTLNLQGHAMTKTGGGSLYLTQDVVGGGRLEVAEGMLVLGNQNSNGSPQIEVDAVVAVDGTSGSTAQLQLGAKKVRIAGLDSIRIPGEAALASEDAAPTSTVEVADGLEYSELVIDTAEGATYDFLGVIDGPVYLTKTGAGTQVIRGDVSLYGFALWGGTLQFGEAEETFTMLEGGIIALGLYDATLNNELVLLGGTLLQDFSGAGEATSLNGHALTLSSATVLELTGYSGGVDATTRLCLFTDVGEVLQEDGSALELHGLLSDYFDISHLDDIYRLATLEQEAGNVYISFANVPEPATSTLSLLALAALAARRRRR